MPDPILEDLRKKHLDGITKAATGNCDAGLKALREVGDTLDQRQRAKFASTATTANYNGLTGDKNKK